MAFQLIDMCSRHSCFVLYWIHTHRNLKMREHIDGDDFEKIGDVNISLVKIIILERYP